MVPSREPVWVGGGRGVSVFAARGAAAARPRGQGAGQEQGCELLHGAFLLFIVPQREVVFPNQSTKNALESGNSRTRAFRLRGTTLLHPCLTTGALWSTGILPRLTGAPVAACAVAVSRAAPRPSSPKPSVPVSTIPGSLCRISLATLLFLAFEGVIQFRLGCT